MTPPLTKAQQNALHALDVDPQWREAKVVGWDTAVSGPLLRLGFDYIALSPRGRRIVRSGKRVAA